MRSYGCSIYHLRDGLLEKNPNGYCFRGLDNSKFFNEDIYITDFKQPEVTDKQRKRLITLTNKITPCEIVTINNKEYIKFKMLHSYDSSLILLNFIRLMWCEFKGCFNTKLFFTELEKRCKKGQDPLEKIMESHNNAVTLDNNYGPGHSNIYKKSSLKIKKKEMLLSYKGYSTSQFMTQ